MQRKINAEFSVTASVTEDDKWFLIAKTYALDINQLWGIWYGNTEDAVHGRSHVDRASRETRVGAPARDSVSAEKHHALMGATKTTRIRRFKVNTRRTQATRIRDYGWQLIASVTVLRASQDCYKSSWRCHDVVRTASRLGKRLTRSPLTMHVR